MALAIETGADATDIGQTIRLASDAVGDGELSTAEMLTA